MWKFLNESVEGTSHRVGGTVCQDHSFVTPFQSDADAGLILACSDGAGSAKESDVGSKVACAAAVEQAMQFLQSGRTAADVDAEVLRAWMAAVHDALKCRGGAADHDAAGTRVHTATRRGGPTRGGIRANR